MWGWGAHTPMELYNIYHTMSDTGTAEYSPYANETVDKYMDEALQAGSLEESYELWQKAQWDEYFRHHTGRRYSMDLAVQCGPPLLCERWAESGGTEDSSARTWMVYCK